MRVQDTVRLLSLAAIWGSSFVFMRVLAPVLGPFWTADLRGLIAGVLLCLYFVVIRFDPEWRRNLRHYLIIGITNSAIPFSLYSYAALHIPAAYSALFNATSPLFGALFAALWLAEPLSLRQLGGIVTGAAGVFLVARVTPPDSSVQFIPSLLACLGAAICYGLSGVYVRKYAAGTRPMGMAGGSQIMAGLILLPVLPFAPPPGTVDGVIVLNMLGLAVLCSAIAYVIYYRLIADIGPTKALTVTFIVPAFGMVWGALFLGEAITLPMLGGALLIVAGTALVTRPAARRVTT